jgi:hypothetical protein
MFNPYEIVKGAGMVTAKAIGAKYLSAGTAAVTKQFRFYDPVS